jgi:hypothetical protein
MTAFTLTELRLKLLAATAEAARGLPRTLDVGAFGEAIVETKHPDWQRAPPGTRGYDFIDTQGRRVQVKTWGTLRRTNNRVRYGEFDRLIIVQLRPENFAILNDCRTETLLANCSVTKLNRVENKARLTVVRSMHVIEEMEDG